MKTLERDLCPDCEQTLREAGLTFSKVTRYGDPPLRCAWCRRKRLTGRVKIAYGRNLK